MSNTPDTFMARAIALSLENVRQGAGGPFAAIVVKDGQVIAERANAVTTTNDPTAHAEVLAIREACRKLQSFDLQGCEIYTSCEPCPMCLGAIYWARPARVYFANSAADAARAGFDDAFIYQEISRPHPERRIPMIQLAHDGALAAFRAWQEQEDKIRY
jgi:guanine deaminase